MTVASITALLPKARKGRSGAVLCSPVQESLALACATGNYVIFLTLLGSALTALAIGWVYNEFMLASIASGALVVAGLAALIVGRTNAIGWVGLTVCNVAMVALHIQLGRGTLEFHFGVFVLLGLLLVYQDWRPLLLGAVLFAVHHIAFDRMQAMGYGVYCMATPSILIVLLHACYVVVQTGIEIVLALRLRMATIESAEFKVLVNRIDQGETLCLDVKDIPVSGEDSSTLSRAVIKIAAAIGEVKTAASSVGEASVAITQSNLDLSGRTEDQAADLSQISESMASLVQVITELAATAGRASTLAESATSVAAEGGAAVRAVVTTMDGISGSSLKISDINEVIDEIAFQTNLLALNAAVEAARAGDQGRGFAVVATEVRLLAQRSADAAREIKDLIGKSVEQVTLGARQVGSAGTNMNDIVKQAENVNQLIREISQKAYAQGTSAAQVSTAVSRLDSATQDNTSMVEQSAKAAQHLQAQATQLNAVVRRFAL